MEKAAFAVKRAAQNVLGGVDDDVSEHRRRRVLHNLLVLASLAHVHKLAQARVVAALAGVEHVLALLAELDRHACALSRAAAQPRSRNPPPPRARARCRRRRARRPAPRDPRSGLRSRATRRTCPGDAARQSPFRPGLLTATRATGCNDVGDDTATVVFQKFPLVVAVRWLG